MSTQKKTLPGDSDFWMFIGIDAAMFSVIFVVLSYFKALHPEAFSQGHLNVSPIFGLVNTLILLSSSYFVAKAVVYGRDQQLEKAQRFFMVSMLFGTGFIIVKSIEYFALINAGHTYSTSTFLSYYYSFTGLHLFHVVIGLVGLWLSTQLYCKKTSINDDGITFLESAGIYWHLVDAIWVFLFLLIYLN